MRRAADTTDAPPNKSSNRREWHLAERAYVDPESDEALSEDQLLTAAWTTACLVARSATRIEARTHREMRAGPLPRRPEDRVNVVDFVFRWLVEESDGVRRRRARRDIRLELHRGRTLLFEMDGDLPFHGAFLSPSESHSLREELEGAGLPGDLCYPLSQRRAVRESVETYRGSTVQRYRHYSPLEWARRETSTEESPASPDLAERRAVFLATCRVFIEELHARDLVLAQHSGRRMPDEMQAVRDLELHVHDLIDHNLLGRAPSYQRKPTAGWSKPPTAWEALDSVWPALTRLHPNDGINFMFATSDPPETWNLWIAAGDEHREYEIRQGVLFGPVTGTPTSPPPLDPRVLFRIPRRGWTRLIDSETAVKIADDAGGSRFRKAGGYLGSTMLRRARGRWIWNLHYSGLRGQYSHRLAIAVDVRTGAVLWQDANRYLFLR
jgi:hypothetical protein